MSMFKFMFMFIVYYLFPWGFASHALAVTQEKVTGQASVPMPVSSSTSGVGPDHKQRLASFYSIPICPGQQRRLI